MLAEPEVPAMQYRSLVEVYDRLDGTSSSLRKADILAETLADAGDLLSELCLLLRGRLFASWEGDDLGVSSSLATDAVVRTTGVDRADVESWWRETGDLGDAAARAVENRRQATLVSDSLDVRTVFETLRGLAGYEGPGSQTRRVDAIADLLADADSEEARYLVRTVLGTMRLGVGEGTLRDAVALAFLDDGDDDAAAAVGRAFEVTNDFRVVARTARDEGAAGLAGLDVEPFRPVKAMLAQKADGVADARDAIRDALFEYKYDGVRVTAHVRGDEVRLFTRRLEDVTAQFPDVVAAVRETVDAASAIVETEVVGRDPESGDPVPFQRLSRRIKRENDIERLIADVPVSVHAFDLLFSDGESLLDLPLRTRLDRLDGVLAESGGVERATAATPGSLDAAESFYADALSAGHEGVIVKNLDAAYQPGSRVGYMLKVKPTMEPLDLVVVGAKWSEGRKSDWLGRLRLACWDADREELREVGRLFSGLTDEELREITAKLEPLVTSVDGRTATIRPEVVVEVEYEEIQESSTYDSGYALRFPRFGGFRDDLDPEDADTYDRVTRLYEEQ
jgi:DNA ligase-1